MKEIIKKPLRMGRDAAKKGRDIAKTFHYYERIRGRHISDVIIYATNRCNSKCQHCHIWEQTPKCDLSLDVFQELMDSPMLSSRAFPSMWVLEGGEFLLHPKYKEILSMFNEHKKNYYVLSNCLLPEKTISMVREFRLKRLIISMDGPKDTYKSMRGVDGWDSVDRVVKELKKETEIMLSYTASPWNTADDFKFVKQYAVANGIHAACGIYGDFKFFNIPKTEDSDYIKDYQFKDRYLNVYTAWKDCHTKIPCLTPRMMPIIIPNGDVMGCCGRADIIGNLYENTIDDIWNHLNTKLFHDSVKECNMCYLSCHRRKDLSMLDFMRKHNPILAKRIE